MIGRCIRRGNTEEEMEEWKKRMVECLSSEDASGIRAEEAIVVKYQNRPNSLFKYRCNNEKARYNLENDLVWVCSPTSYNDPFDSSISIAAETLTKTVIQDVVKEFIAKELGSKVDARKTEQILDAPNPALALQELIMAEMDQVPQEHRERFRGPLEAQMKAWEEAFNRLLPASHKESLKVCSFSETQYSIIMWSHYADQHRGFCVEYDCLSLPPESLFVRMLYPVIYSEKLFEGTKYYLAAIRDQKTFNVLFPALAALHKSPEWSYEKEWRLVIPANLVKKPSLWRVPSAKRVYLGERIPAGEKERIIEICERKSIEVHQMHLADDSFCLRSKVHLGTPL
jgi:hypothetical protein